jgi:hypothetical protein
LAAWNCKILLYNSYATNIEQHRTASKMQINPDKDKEELEGCDQELYRMYFMYEKHSYVQLLKIIQGLQKANNLYDAELKKMKEQQ